MVATADAQHPTHIIVVLHCWCSSSKTGTIRPPHRSIAKFLLHHHAKRNAPFSLPSPADPPLRPPVYDRWTPPGVRLCRPSSSMRSKNLFFMPPQPRRGRFFVTQGNGSSPHRKVRPAGPRFGASSEPSSSPSRNGIGLSPQFSKSTNGTSAGVVNRHPTILGVITSALAAKRGIGETLDEKNWRELPQWNSPLNRETSGVNRFRRGCPAAATAAVSARRSSQGGRRQSVQRKEIEQTSVGDSPVAARRRRSRLGSTSRPPYATVPSSDAAEIVSIGDCSGGVGGDRGGGGGGGGWLLLLPLLLFFCACARLLWKVCCGS